MSDPERVLREFSVLEKNPLGPRYNVAPSQGVWAICAMPGDDGPALHQLRWGLPATQQRPAAPVIMLRSETVARGAMAASFAARRCLLLADGFFEWHRTGKTSQPHLFRRPNDAPFAMAGIWQPSDGGPLSGACAVLTCPAVGAMSAVHHRMPLVLEPTHHAGWLDPTNHSLPLLKGMLASPPLSDFVSIRVSPRVGSPANDDARCVAPISEVERAGEQGDLFGKEKSVTGDARSRASQAAVAQPFTARRRASR